eukprot:TRINITY_DN8498_c0_g1_i1.p1 TRINITY_DN8498_c0_g1~~TRINITY_DN8498_c0_g1_i1.p1  ORF type:complete len:193 (-),score=42.66 TRINITY_DN8498_c0_g1_i1:18-596(-)
MTIYRKRATLQEKTDALMIKNDFVYITEQRYDVVKMQKTKNNKIITIKIPTEQFDAEDDDEPVFQSDKPADTENDPEEAFKMLIDKSDSGVLDVNCFCTNQGIVVTSVSFWPSMQTVNDEKYHIEETATEHSGRHFKDYILRSLDMEDKVLVEMVRTCLALTVLDRYQKFLRFGRKFFEDEAVKTLDPPKTS